MTRLRLWDSASGDCAEGLKGFHSSAFTLTGFSRVCEFGYHFREVFLLDSSLR